MLPINRIRRHPRAVAKGFFGLVILAPSRSSTYFVLLYFILFFKYEPYGTPFQRMDAQEERNTAADIDVVETSNYGILLQLGREEWIPLLRVARRKESCPLFRRDP